MLAISIKPIRRGVFAAVVFSVLVMLSGAGARGFIVGADPNYILGMETAGKGWLSVKGEKEDVLKILKDSGVEMIRVRLWSKDGGTNGLEESTALMKRAKAAGLKLYVVMFLSEDWADYVKQPAPGAWKGLPFDEKVGAVGAYAERVARHFKEQGLEVDCYEIGNEIDFGICGEFEEEWAKRVSVDYMKATIWPRMAGIIAAAQGGIQKAGGDTKFMLHLTQWWNPEYCTAFFQAMGSSGVKVDFAGLSFFPTSNLSKENSTEYFLEQAGKLAKATLKPVVVCEYGYPSQARFTGQFSEWNVPVAGYTLDEEGQSRWLADFLGKTEKAGFLEGVFYWSPEWHDSGMWSAFALFGADGKPKKALGAFK